MIRDKLPKTIRPQTFGVAVDVARRYAYRGRGEPENMTGWTAIEADAYIGFRAIRYGERVGPSGKVIAVEIDAANCELMRLNIEANGLSDRVIPIHTALGASDGEGIMRSDSHQKHSIVPMAD